ncbi:hypothetical protein [Streptomyces sp. G-G2]|uniref:hypothetical protein n=1 Tax=Streptomyces sp. G-G2 TaxID=3046201 RepID=UPI0024B8D14C|nr:hypothetical protein [Streptomyces sp. G-G2]MDJ0386263.1 hypothetical protein [Streptomyces sp. G-G2]
MFSTTQHRAHLTWHEGPVMELSVRPHEREGEAGSSPASEGQGAVDTNAPLLVQGLTVPCDGDWGQAQAEATRALLAAGWHLHSDWQRDGGAFTAVVDRQPADDDDHGPMPDGRVPDSAALVADQQASGSMARKSRMEDILRRARAPRDTP